MKTIPSFDELNFEQTAPGCTAEYVNYMPRGKNGLRCWEILARTGDGILKIVVLRDCGYKIDSEVIDITPFTDRIGRNKEICRLYNEKNISQVFLANLFDMSQPSVSMIIKASCKK